MSIRLISGMFAATALALSGANPAKAAQLIDDASLRLPEAGDYALRILTPSLLELEIVSAPAKADPPLNLSSAFHASDFDVKVDGKPARVATLGFRRRVLYAPVQQYDLRVATEIYLSLPTALSGAPTQEITVIDRKSPLWPADRVFTSKSDPLRYSPAIHVNQEGYTPQFPKTAFVGYFTGTLGEMSIPVEAGFDLIESATGRRVFHGSLRPRKDVGFGMSPKPYQQVYEADFSPFDTPGEYRLAVPGLGASLPFRIDAGELMNFARAYALGLYHQRCGTALELPYTRFTHAACHTAPASVPYPPEKFAKTWQVIGSAEEDSGKGEHPEKQLKRPEQQYYPFVRKGAIDVSRGHHDAGDYSKYTIDSANFIHVLIFAVDSLPGVAGLDNLGLPESGDGIGDILQEAKWESDFLSKMQDEDGGFYFLVYPRDRRYESGPPDQGDPQVVWPKTTSVTAAAVAALAQCSSSPEFKRHYPDEAQRYLAQAKHGWEFLEKAIAQHGREGAYQRLTHYGDLFEDNDELAWAACELFLATGERKYEDKLLEWYPNPTDASTRQWQWRRAVFAYGNALRSYAFAESSGRLRRNQLDAGYQLKCEQELRRAGDDALRAADQSAYGVSFPEESKRINAAGWFFASDQAFDLTVAYQLQRRPAYRDAILTNLNFEAGCNPVNRCLITGLGQRRQREIVHQFAQADDRRLPPSGIPLGSLQSQFQYMDIYGTQLREETWPKDEGPGLTYPLYDRWSDAYNLATEFVIVNQARSLASIAYWAAQTPLKDQAWRAASATIVGGKPNLRIGAPVSVQLACPAVDLSSARIVWEARDQEPAYGPTFTVVPRHAGAQWIEAEASLPDGRRVFARYDFRSDAPIIYWLDGQLPAGATTSAQGGDTWTWIQTKDAPPDDRGDRATREHVSANAGGIHEHAFDNAQTKLEVGAGDVLFVDVYLDPKHPPKTLMLEWNDGSFDHRAYWGPNLIPWGKPGTPSQWWMGRMPPAGRWIRLEVPAHAVGLEGHSVKGMAFRLYDGAARWAAAGKMSRMAASQYATTVDTGTAPPVEDWRASM